MDLVTLAQVKRHSGQKTDEVTNDTVLSELITAVSVEVEKYLDRAVQSVSRTEDVWLPRGSRRIAPKGYPIASIASIAAQEADKLGVTATPTYLTEPNAIRLETPQTADCYIRMTYVGGMAADTAAFMARFPDISEVVSRRVWVLYKRRQNADMLSQAQEGGSTQYAYTDFNKRDRETLNRYRRLM